jgi:hypothetical protein
MLTKLNQILERHYYTNEDFITRNKMQNSKNQNQKSYWRNNASKEVTFVGDV